MFIDSHAHLSLLIKGKEIQLIDIINEMNENNVKAILNVCGEKDELEFSESVKNEFIKNNISFFSAAGVHPHEAEKFESFSTDWISQKRDEIIAIGEIGLDFHYNFSPQNIQRNMLRKMIELSLELQKPLIIHGRSGEEEIIETLLKYGFKGKKVLFHCYTGSLETVKKIFENGWYISFSGILTFKNSTDILEILKNSDLNKIFFETDSPFLSPAPFRGKINTPAKVKYVYEFASKSLNIELPELCDQVKRNFENFFSLSL